MEVYSKNGGGVPLCPPPGLEAFVLENTTKANMIKADMNPEVSAETCTFMPGPAQVSSQLFFGFEFVSSL